MTSIIESLLAVFKDFHWLVSIDTLLIFFVNYLMFHAAGRVKISWWLLLLGGLLSVVLTPLLPMGFKFLLNPLILFCFSYYKRPDLPWIEPVFNSFYAWGTTNIIIRGLSLIVFPLLLGDDLMSRIPESLTEFICVVVTYPLYLLVHRFIGYEYLQVEEKERLRIHFTPIVIGVSFAFLSYGLLNDFMPYFASIWPVEVVNNYAKLIVLLATGAFFIVVSYANQWIKDELFLELKEEQERHFQSLQESSRHILHLYQELYRDGVPKVVVPKKAKTVLATSQEGDSQNLSEEEVPFSKVMPDISNLLSQLLRSVIESKYMEFHAVGIDFIMEIPDPISPSHIDIVDLSAVLTTFLDNALLRAHGQENSLVRLSYYQSGEVQVLSVETTLSQDSAEAPHKAYENHLSINEQIEDIMERYPQSKLSFKNDKFIYRQQFEY
jgi:signal transduction histidine kinase